MCGALCYSRQICWRWGVAAWSMGALSCSPWGVGGVSQWFGADRLIIESNKDIADVWLHSHLFWFWFAVMYIYFCWDGSVNIPQWDPHLARCPLIWNHGWLTGKKEASREINIGWKQWKQCEARSPSILFVLCCSWTQELLVDCKMFVFKDFSSFASGDLKCRSCRGLVGYNVSWHDRRSPSILILHN